ncbi:hypothetical protein M8C21_032927, partial [Ambrosia artemisiifolia]
VDESALSLEEEEEHQSVKKQNNTGIDTHLGKSSCYTRKSGGEDADLEFPPISLLQIWWKMQI